MNALPAILISWLNCLKRPTLVSVKLPLGLFEIGGLTCAAENAGPPRGVTGPLGPAGVPASLSAATRRSYERLIARLATRPPRERPATVEEFEAVAAAREAEARPFAERDPNVQACKVATIDLDGVAAVELIPPDLRDEAVILYVHGGAFTLLSAWSTLAIPARLALGSGRRVISIDYPLAPRRQWQAITQAVVDAYAEVISRGNPPKSIGVVGDSAGGAIAMSAVHQARDLGFGSPGAVALISTVSDLTLSGDTIITLQDQELILELDFLRSGYAAYSDETDRSLPLVSPAFAAYDPAFPPTLLQVGTREMLLSDTILLCDALRLGGVDTILQVYEGMPHSFHAALSDSEEAERAFREQVDFFNEKLLVKLRTNDRR